MKRLDRMFLVASLLAGGAVAARPALADTTPRPGETPTPSDAAAAGKSAPYDLFGTKGTRSLGFALDIGAANSGLPDRPLGMGGQVALDSFVLDRVSIGGQFGFQYATVDGSFYNVGGGPRLGYALRLGDKLVLWPMLTLTYDAGTVPTPSTGGSASLQDLRVGGYAPLVITMGGQVAFEMGPVASTDLWRSVAGQDAARMDLIGLRTGLVGWF
ncbi:MAG: hypothetical protein ABSE49_15860 [Polyangiaceae bacterium]